MAQKPPADEKMGLGVKIPATLFKRLGHYLVEHPKLKQAAVVAEALDEYLKKRGA